MGTMVALLLEELRQMDTMVTLLLMGMMELELCRGDAQFLGSAPLGTLAPSAPSALAGPLALRVPRMILHRLVCTLQGLGTDCHSKDRPCSSSCTPHLQRRERIGNKKLLGNQSATDRPVDHRNRLLALRCQLCMRVGWPTSRRHRNCRLGLDMESWSRCFERCWSYKKQSAVKFEVVPNVSTTTQELTILVGWV